MHSGELIPEMCHSPTLLPAPALKVVGVNMVTDDGFANRGADELGVEAVYSRDRAIEDKQALSGYDVGPCRLLAQTGSALVRSIWTGRQDPKSAVA